MSGRRSVSILAPLISENSLGRAYLIAKLLQCQYDVHIVALGNLEDLWAPVRMDYSIEYRSFECQDSLEFFRKREEISRLVTGDVIYAVKPRLASFGLALFARQQRHRPLLLDIDDWEIGFLAEKWYWEPQYGLKRWLLNMRSPLYVRLLDWFTWLADGITVSNSFLQTKYGGILLPHARDEKMFAVPKGSGTGVRNDNLTVLFLGTPRQHKGLELLLEAWQLVRSDTARLRIVGMSSDSEMASLHSTSLDSRISIEGFVPFENVPSILAAADIVVIPQLLDRASTGQLPAKLIDAMAAGKAVVSTLVGDIPHYLSDGAGVVVPPGDAKALAQAIEGLIDSPDAIATMGEKARARFMAEASFCRLRPKVFEFMEQYF